MITLPDHKNKMMSNCRNSWMIPHIKLESNEQTTRIGHNTGQFCGPITAVNINRKKYLKISLMKDHFATVVLFQLGTMWLLPLPTNVMRTQRKALYNFQGIREMAPRMVCRKRGSFSDMIFINYLKDRRNVSKSMVNRLNKKKAYPLKIIGFSLTKKQKITYA